LAKILSNRTKRVLNKVVDRRQSAFLSGRSLAQCVLLTNEVVHEAKRKRKSYLIFKVYYEKTFDSVNWKFLFYILRRLGFNEKWVLWIKAYLGSSYTSILVNESPIHEFTISIGLRQGDPLLLFNVVVEGLCGLMRETIEKELFTSFLMGENNVQVNLLHFADDTLFIGEATWTNVVVIKSILRCFELALGLKVNFFKSNFDAFGVDSSLVERFVDYLNCKLLSLPFTYLGLPIGGNRRCQLFWKPILNKFSKKHSKWTRGSLL